MSNEDEFKTPADVAPSPAEAALQGGPPFLYVPVSRLILMSIVSFGLYEAYWIYRNWRYLKDRNALKIRPFWRGVFGVFYCHSLLRRIHDDETARAVEEPSFNAGALATGWVILVVAAGLMSRLPGVVVSIVSAFIPSYLCFVPVQRYVNAVTRKLAPAQPYYRWSAGHILCLVLGLIIWAGLLLGLLVKAGS